MVGTPRLEGEGGFSFEINSPSVVRPTLLYISSEAVIPGKAGIQIKNTGFRVKPGMTIEVKGLLTQYTRILVPIPLTQITETIKNGR